MPIWKIHHGPNTFTSQEKNAIAKGATDFYVKHGLPSWYVNVLFFETNPENFFTGGTPQSRTIIAEITHLARHIDPNDKETALTFKDGMDSIFGPYTIDKGYNLEFTVLEGPAGLWRINGIDPPEAFGPDEQEQAEKNRNILNEQYSS